MNPQKEILMNESNKTYEPPAIIYEGDLEIQAGSPLGLPALMDLEDSEL